MKLYLKTSQYISAMAEDRRKILDTCYNYSDKIAEHVIKCVIYGPGHKDYDHWIEEIVSYIEDINSMKPKKGFKLKPKDYRNNLFVGIGDELQDAKRALKRFYKANVLESDDPYPSFNIEYETYSRVFDAFHMIADVVSNRLGKYPQDNAKTIIKNSVKDILDYYS